MIYSWYLTYPLSTLSANDLVFYHVSILYWLSLPLLLVSMFLMAVTIKSKFFRWILSIGIVLTFFSLPYFYYMMPTNDSQFIRGLVEYFVKTKSLDPSQLNHNYYQWPAFFVVANIVTSISGLTLANYEFLLYAIIAFLVGTVLYVYGSKKFTNGGVIVVAVFFIPIYYFIDYQSVPFSLAIGLLFILFMLGTEQKSSSSLFVTMLVLYASILITHLFVPIFFVLYLLARSLFDKNSQNKRFYRSFFLIALVIYFLVQSTLARFSFNQMAKSITQTPIESLSSIASNSLTTPFSNPIYYTSQFFSRTVIIASVLLCVAGFILLSIRRKLNIIDKAILFAGVAYSSLGFVLNTLGWRSIELAFIPISLGAAYLFQGKFKAYFSVLFSILLVLFLFLPLIQSFNTGEPSQTRETYNADNFFIGHYNWTNPGFVVSDFRTNTYLGAKLSVYVYLFSWLQAGEKADAILYTPPFIGSELGNYSSTESLSQGERLNLLYNDGFSCMLIKST